jgi:L-threonylcarbamoyladenylate synthase
VKNNRRTMNTEVIPADEPQAMQNALSILKDGALVAFPTDTVYGIGALAHIPDAVGDLYAVKGRHRTKAIPVLLGHLAELERVAVDVSSAALRLAERFWPGPLTIIVPRHPELPLELSPLPTIGVRIPNHPVALALLRLTGPLAVTSANLSGKANTLTASEVLAQLGGRIALILDGGRTPGGHPSTVVDPSGGKLVILRAGPLSREDLLAVLGEDRASS